MKLRQSEFIRTSMIPEPSTNWQKFEYFLWKDFISLAYQHLNSAPWANKHAVAAWRILAFLYLFGLAIWTIADDPKLCWIYFTKWGVFITTITYGILAAYQVRQYILIRSKKSVLQHYQNFYSPWLLWKWGIIFYESAFTFEVVITLFFWAILYPDSDHSDPNNLRNNLLLHASPIVVLVTDYVINRIPFQFKHLPLSLFILIVYGLVNMIYTLTSGTPVYPPLNFKDGMTAVWVLVLFCIETGTYTGMYFLTRWKIRKYRLLDADSSSELTIFEVTSNLNSFGKSNDNTHSKLIESAEPSP
ncbi:UNKNOWN [Stylonychia lemnae]|uniref:Uncharacterized protein n=1 Tax=Stylonychia lemnae TaxID=5949 RepID=A0A078BBB2_STYLE|nr:UNKNOWN [Stylonychia lemnae]|eukprot:CDW91679.1 UNKNOWN [Stylonychia lemnae]